VLYLEVKMASKPVIEERFLNIAGGFHLQLDPGFCLVYINLHRDVVRLGHPGKPVTLQTPVNCKYIYVTLIDSSSGVIIT